MAWTVGSDGLIPTTGSSTVTKLLMGTFTLDPPNVLASISGDVNVTISGLDVASNWHVHVQPLGANLTAGLGVGSVRVSADNTITIRFLNASILAIDNPSQTFSYLAIK